MSINSFAAIVSDNDGSAFVTKAEFDALKASFNKQIDDYNASIDGKIDGAIASYLAGLTIKKRETIINQSKRLFAEPGKDTVWVQAVGTSAKNSEPVGTTIATYSCVRNVEPSYFDNPAPSFNIINMSWASSHIAGGSYAPYAYSGLEDDSGPGSLNGKTLGKKVDNYKSAGNWFPGKALWVNEDGYLEFFDNYFINQNVSFSFLLTGQSGRKMCVFSLPKHKADGSLFNGKESLLCNQYWTPALDTGSVWSGWNSKAMWANGPWDGSTDIDANVLKVSDISYDSTNKCYTTKVKWLTNSGVYAASAKGNWFSFDGTSSSSVQFKGYMPWCQLLVAKEQKSVISTPFISCEWDAVNKIPKLSNNTHVKYICKDTNKYSYLNYGKSQQVSNFMPEIYMTANGAGPGSGFDQYYSMVTAQIMPETETSTSAYVQDYTYQSVKDIFGVDIPLRYGFPILESREKPYFVEFSAAFTDLAADTSDIDVHIYQLHKDSTSGLLSCIPCEYTIDTKTDYSIRTGIIHNFNCKLDKGNYLMMTFNLNGQNYGGALKSISDDLILTVVDE